MALRGRGWHVRQPMASGPDNRHGAADSTAQTILHPPMTVQIQPGAIARIAPSGLAFLAITSVGWGLNFPIMKHLLTEWPPLSSRGLCGIAGAGALALVFTLGGVALALRS